MKTEYIFVFLFFVIGIHSAPKVQQLSPSKMSQSLTENQFTLVYFYSATCSFCKEFTPKFEQLSKVYSKQNVNFGKIDATVYKDFAQKYNVFSYPTITLFWKGIDMPIYFRKERQVQNLLNFIKTSTIPFQATISAQKFHELSTEVQQSGILFVGNPNTFEHNVTTVLSLVESYRGFVRMDANITQPYLEIKGEKYFDFGNPIQLREVIRKAFIRTYVIEEQSWMRIFQSKDIGIVFIDTEENKKVMKILEKLALEYPHLVFMRIDPSQEEYQQAIGALQVQDEENIFGVDQIAQAKFQAETPLTEDSLRTFIVGVLDRSLPVYLPSQKEGDSLKLTRRNFDKKINEPKDVVLFLYRQEDKSSKKFLTLFKYIHNKVKKNSNLSLLRCNMSKNQISDKIGLEIKVTPWILFYGNRMKNVAPVHFQKQMISTQNVIQFIKENTTFDWEQQQTEL